MSSYTIQNILDIENNPKEFANNFQVIEQNIVVTDIIVILDESGSMDIMEKEPVQSVNIFLREQQKSQLENGCDANVTLMTFNTQTKTIIDNQKLSTVKEVKETEYKPTGRTALNDTICSTIKTKLCSDKHDDVVLVIITDGEENSSHTYSAEDTKNMIKQVEEIHSWKVIFIGANFDVLSIGQKMNINNNRCAQYDQSIPGSLMSLCRTVSSHIKDYRRSRSEGNKNIDLEIHTGIKQTLSSV